MNYLYAMAVIMISTVLAVLSKYPDYYWLIVSDFNVALALFLAWAMEKKMTNQTEALTDSQCDEFRRLPMSFNDMVRAIYKAGQEALEQPADGIELEWYCKGWDDAEKDLATQEPKSPTILARLPNGTTASNVYEAYEAGLKEGKAETQEPVAWLVFDGEGHQLGHHKTSDMDIPLYTTPPSRECNCKDKK